MLFCCFRRGLGEVCDGELNMKCGTVRKVAEVIQQGLVGFACGWCKRSFTRIFIKIRWF